MPVVKDNNLLVEGDPVSLHSGTRTGNGNGAPEAVGDHHTARLTLAVTAASGTTPSLTVTVQHSEDGTTWRTHTAFAAKTAVSTERLTLSGLDRFLRVSWAITGTTPSFTFTVSGELV